MPTIAEKRADLEKASQRIKATLDEAKTKGVGLTGEQNTELERLIDQSKTWKREIEDEQKLEAKQHDLEDLHDFLNRPQGGVPHGINGDDEDTKNLKAIGWESKGGTWYAPTSLTVNGDRFMQPMYPDEVLRGPMPTEDNDARQFVQKTRAIFRPEYRAAFIKHMRVMAATQDSGMAYNALTNEEQKSLAEGSDTAGGFLVPPDAQAEMLARVAQQAVIRSRARVQPTSSDILRWPAITPAASTNGSIFSSGFIGGWVGETPAFTQTDPSFQQFAIPVKKLRVATKLSNDLVQDAQVNILAFLSQNGAENMALVEDQGFINGDGGPLQPRGILNVGANSVNVEGITANTIDNNSTIMGSATKIINLSYTLPAAYTRNASWLMQRATEGLIRVLVAGTGGFLWPGGAFPGFAAVPRALLDFPIDNSDFMQAVGTDANKVIVFGDLSQYIIAQRAQISSRVLNERFADTDEVGIILFERVGGDMWNTDAIRYGTV